MDDHNTTQTNETPQTQQQDADINRPEDTLRDGSLKATIWRNEGENGEYYSTTIARTWQDEDGNYRDSHSFSGSELLRVSELARGAYARTNELKQEQQQAQDKKYGRMHKDDRQQDMGLDQDEAQEQSREDFKQSRAPRSRRSRQNVQR